VGFGGILRQSTAVDVLVGPFVDSADGDSEETGLTIAQADVRLSKNGQSGAQKNDNTTCAHDADGFYNCELDATDTNTVGQLTLWVHVAGALAVRHDYQVVEEAVYDALYAASAVGPLLANANGSTLTEAGGTGDHLTAVPWNSAWDAEVQSEAADALNAYDPPTNAEMVARTLASADYATAANLATVDGVVDAILVDTAEIGAAGAGLTALASQASVNDLPTNAELATALGSADDAVLAAIAALNNLSSADVNAACDTAISDAALATAANLATVDTVVDAVKAKTDSLTFTVAGQVDANTQSINDVTITGDGQVGTEFGV